jgi:hypothetical protein
MSLRSVLLALLSLLLAGCVSQPQWVETAKADSELQPWLEKELIPYLTQQLASQPRFKGEPVVLVKIDGANIQPRIDRLTRSIRAQLRDALLDTPGVTLPWEPRVKRPQHHRRAARLDCRSLSQAELFIGLEFGTTASGLQRLSVRAFDIGSRTWVSGFGRSWQGRLTAREQAALYRLEVDEALRGLRVLPFGAGQRDLAAEYLANNLSCLLRQQETLPPVFIDAPKGRESRQLADLLHLTGNQLARFGELRITEQRAEAGVLLRAEQFRLGGGVSQVWIRLLPTTTGSSFAGLDTATYLSSDATSAQRTKRPEIRGLQLTRHDDCAAADSCLTLRAESDNAVRLWLFSYSPEGGPVRYSGRCQRSSGSAVLLRLNGSGHRPNSTYYAVALAADAPTTSFERLFAQLPDGCDGTPPVTAPEGWLDRLDLLVAQHRPSLDWQARRVP